MPASAYALVGLFTLIAGLSGGLAARLIGPWRWWTPIAPGMVAFALLYLIGHRYPVSLGPTMTVFGWEVALPFDVTVALAGAATAALAQRSVLGLLQAQERGAGRDGLA